MVEVKMMPISDLDVSKPLPVLIEEERSRIVKIRSHLQDMGRCLGWKDRFEDTIGLLNCGLVALHSVKQEITDAESEWRERDEKAGNLPKSYGVNSRGMGSDHTPGCFVCGGAPGLYGNISMFVKSKEDGEAVVALFKSGARLDYREREPNWIQVKVGACHSHEANLEDLAKKVGGYPYRITAPMVEEAAGKKA